MELTLIPLAVGILAKLAATSGMNRYIDLGVDDIITDKPEALAALLRNRSELSDLEFLLLKSRSWLLD